MGHPVRAIMCEAQLYIFKPKKNEMVFFCKKCIKEAIFINYNQLCQCSKKRKIRLTKINSMENAKKNEKKA